MARFLGNLCTNLKNLPEIDLCLKNKIWNLVKSVKKWWKSLLEAREMIFIMYSIFETCSEFDGKNFCKNRFLKKSFLKVFISPNFVILSSILVTKIKLKWRLSKMIFSKTCFYRNLMVYRNLSHQILIKSQKYYTW